MKHNTASTKLNLKKKAIKSKSRTNKPTRKTKKILISMTTETHH